MPRYVFDFRFFHESVFSKPLSILLELFKIFRKFADILAAGAPLVSLIPVMHLDLRISPRIFGKIRNDPTVTFRGLGKVIHEINLKQKSRDTVP